MAQAVAVSTAGGSVVAGFVEENKDKPLTLRPPGALEESEFFHLAYQLR